MCETAPAAALVTGEKTGGGRAPAACIALPAAKTSACTHAKPMLVMDSKQYMSGAIVGLVNMGVGQPDASHRYASMDRQQCAGRHE